MAKVQKIKRADHIQAVIIAGQLKGLGHTDPFAVPLAVWLSLGFLQRPTDSLVQAVADCLKMYGQDT